MNNLEQLRAASALKYWKSVDSSDDDNRANRISSLIINNGLLGALAFAIDKKEGYASLMKNIIDYLCNTAKVFDESKINNQRSSDPLLDAVSILSDVPLVVLQRATLESLAYLSYLKRFAPKKEQSRKEQKNEGI